MNENIELNDQTDYEEIEIIEEITSDNTSLVVVNDNKSIQLLENSNSFDDVKKARAQSLTKEISTYVNSDEREQFVNNMLQNKLIDARYKVKSTSTNIDENMIASLILINEGDLEIIDPIDNSKKGYLHHNNFFDAVYTTNARGSEKYKIIFANVNIIITMLNEISLCTQLNKTFIADALATKLALVDLSKNEIRQITDKLIELKFIDLDNDFISKIDKYKWGYKNFSNNEPSNEELYALHLLKDYVLVDIKGIFRFIDINNYEKIYSSKELKIKFQNKTLLIENPDTGKSKKINPVDIYLESKYRKEYVDIVFNPSYTFEDNVLNLFKGFKYKPIQVTDITLFKNFVKNDLCDGDEIKFKVLWSFFAHGVQRPWEKTGICPVMTSPEGAGKGTLMRVMGEIFSGYYMTSKDIKHITGQFSKHLERVLLFYGNEVNLTGSALQKFKNAVTEIMTTSEGKGIDAYSSNNYTRFVLDGNKRPIDNAGRRWFDIYIKGEKVGNQNFWISLNEHINTEGFYESLMYDLYTFDYKPYKQYLYEAPKFESKNIFDNPILIWWSQCLQNGTIPYVPYDITPDDGLNITNENKFKSYKKWCRDFGITCNYDIINFGKEFAKKVLCNNDNLEKAGKITDEGKRLNSKIFMRLTECREAFLQNYDIEKNTFIGYDWQVLK